MFDSLRGYHVKMCRVKKYVWDREMRRVVEEPISGRVVIDAYAYYKVRSKVPKVLFALTSSPGGCCPPPPAPPGRVPIRVNSGAADHVHTHVYKGVDRKEDMTPLTDVECLIASTQVKGFDLRAKEWCRFDVDDIKDVVWDDSPYDNLVLPSEERELVFAFANCPRFSKLGFDDFVVHKGEGIIILLTGPPGVGKTLTAEAVAEKSRVPLYIVSASELCTQAEIVEHRLRAAFECCQLWGAVLLIEEADVFLESRESNDLERNKLVSIFLRWLEYYRGSIFLTTNRITAIDSAVKSRIDLVLPYFYLDEPSRRQVWVNSIQELKPGTASISDSDLDKLAKMPLNGRDINKAIKTALVLANTDKPLRLKHLEVVLGIHSRASLLGQHDQPEHSTS